MENYFTKNLKDLRAEFGISQAQLAKRLNIAANTISRWETGFSEPSIQQILDFGFMRLLSNFNGRITETLKNLQNVTPTKTVGAARYIR